MRIRVIAIAMLAHVSFGAWAAGNTGDSYPGKPIRVLLGFPPGGAGDYVMRIIGAKLTERFAQPVIIDNRSGAGGNIAAEITARASADGYTLMLGAMTPLTSSPSLYPKLGYDLLKDFSYISLVATDANVLLVHPSLPAKSVAELVTLARSKPQAIRYGSGGTASIHHLTMELLQRRAAITLLHVPYKGGSASVGALAGGEVQIAFASTTAAMPMIQARRLHALAVSSAKRLGALPEVPTVAESGYAGFNVTQAFGLLAPAALPAAIVRLLNTETRNIIRMDDVRAKLATQSLEAVDGSPDEFRATVAPEIAQWARVIKDAGITAN